MVGRMQKTVFDLNSRRRLNWKDRNCRQVVHERSPDLGKVVIINALDLLYIWMYSRGPPVPCPQS